LVRRETWRVKGEKWAKRGRNSAVGLDDEEWDDRDYYPPG
jgi:hypothetical protein